VFLPKTQLKKRRILISFGKDNDLSIHHVSSSKNMGRMKEGDELFDTFFISFIINDIHRTSTVCDDSPVSVTTSGMNFTPS